MVSVGLEGLANAGMYVVIMSIAARLGPSVCNWMIVYKFFFAYLMLLFLSVGIYVMKQHYSFLVMFHMS